MKPLTTGQIAGLLQVAPRTVSGWIDKGMLPGFRIPGSQDRRVPVQNFIKFCDDHGLPLPEDQDFILLQKGSTFTIDGSELKVRRVERHGRTLTLVCEGAAGSLIYIGQKLDGSSVRMAG